MEKISIKQWINNNRQGRKILVASHLENANAVLTKNNGYGIDVSSLFLLARTLVIEGLAQMGKIDTLTIIDDVMASAIISQILEEHQKEITFVPQACFCDETSAEVVRIMKMVRENPKDVLTMIEDVKKWEEIQKLIALYEDYLKENHLFDHTSLILTAIHFIQKGIAKPPKNTAYGILDDGRTTVIEKKLIQAMGRFDDVNIVAISTEVPDPNIELGFFKAYGKANEVAYVIDEILHRKIPFGQVAISYTSDEYIPFIQGCFGSKGILYAMISGVPAGKMPLINLMTAILDWAGSDYLYQDYQKILRNPALYKIERDEAVVYSLKRFYQDIRQEIGWGRDRYLKYADGLKAKAKDLNTDDEKVMALSASHGLYADFLRDLCACFENDNAIDIFDQMVALIKEYAVSRNDMMAKYRSLMGDIRPVIAMKKTNTLSDAIREINKAMNRLKIRDGVSPLAISVRKLSDVVVMDRPVQFVLGLSQSAFHQNDAQSPVLSDDELTKLLECENGNVVLKKEQDKRRKEDILKSFSTLEEGEIHLGYAYYDTVNLRPDSASPFFLSCYKKFGKGKTIKEIPTYSDLMDTSVRINGPENQVSIENKAQSEKNGRKPFRMSASSLGTLMTCPLHFRYQFVDGLPNVEYPEKNDDIWLPANKKGTFFHTVLQVYSEKAFKQEEIKDVLDETLYQTSFELAKKEAEETMPALSAHQKKKELEEFDQTLRKQLTKMHEDFSSSDWRVYACELAYKDLILASFDDEGNEDSTSSTGIDLIFKGFIDRVDIRIVDGVKHFRIIDYKTGKKKGVQAGIDAQTQLQHFIYAMAIHKLFPDGVVDEVIYEMVSDETPIILKGEDLLHLPENVKNRIIQMASGEFETPDFKEMTKEEIDAICRFCHYQDICIQKIGEVL